jgi:hypothetical protein
MAMSQAPCISQLPALAPAPPPHPAGMGQGQLQQMHPGKILEHSLFLMKIQFFYKQKFKALINLTAVPTLNESKFSFLCAVPNPFGTGIYSPVALFFSLFVGSASAFRIRIWVQAAIESDPEQYM